MLPSSVPAFSATWLAGGCVEVVGPVLEDLPATVEFLVRADVTARTARARIDFAHIAAVPRDVGGACTDPGPDLALSQILEGCGTPTDARGLDQSGAGELDPLSAVAARVRHVVAISGPDSLKRKSPVRLLRSVDLDQEVRNAGSSNAEHGG